ncbi:adenylate/guanylate cyclase domain-containing protein [Pantanalinema sp. GBBB05]|uniref:adenylate/guanylate cyclase domain-containing protein n=1 Tax=Pantanalinema sp. GBBB05 TaxID=2604139 RepID=UPI001D2A77A7|nr:adenylate/guanylate cyclase domain-containing protein [Pantanalinema sp. GBBB05]
MLQIHYLPDQRTVDAGQAFTLLDVSLETGIPHTHVCGGNARCSTCRVLILEGLEHCAPRTSAEQSLAQQLQFDANVRLACQTEIQGEGLIKLRRLSLDAHDLELFHNQVIGKTSPHALGQEQQIAILFADIRGFTSFSEALLPYDVIYILNRYFQLMGQVISRHGGTINVYMGDGLMALFGVDHPDRAVERAIRAGLDMLQAVDELNPSIEALYQHRLRIGIGIHYGWTVIGSIGDPNNPKMTAIGDAVNLASRIEAANKQVGTMFLISEEAYQQVKEQVVVNQSFEVKLPGKTGEYSLYEVIDIAAAEPSETLPAPLAIAQRASQPRWLTALQQIITGLGHSFSKLIGLIFRHR